MRRVIVIASTAALTSMMPVLAASAAHALDPTGIWINDTGRGAIEIKPCGNALCGNVVWVKDAADVKGCGKQIIGNVAPAGSGLWGNGWIYSPEKGRRYNVELKPLANDRLRVTGYAGLRFLSKTMIWTRAPADLQLCGQPHNQIEAKPEGTQDAKSNSNLAATSSPPAATPDSSADGKSSTRPEVAIVTPPAKPEAKAAPAEKPDAKIGAGPHDSVPLPSGAHEAAPPQSEPPPAASTDAKPDTSQNDEQTAAADDDAGSGSGSGSGSSSGSGLEEKLNDLGLGKVFTKTKTGKCRIDLPWVKLTVDCEQ